MKIVVKSFSCKGFSVDIVRVVKDFRVTEVDMKFAAMPHAKAEDLMGSRLDGVDFSVLGKIPKQWSVRDIDHLTRA